MPFMPAARMTANERYGLHAGSGERISMRVDWPLAGLYMGTRTSAERLLWPQQTYEGASPPAINRLYEFTHWLVTAVISGACRRRPAMNARATLESWNSPPGSWNALRSPSNSDRWVCMPEPAESARGLGMNEA